MFVASRMPIRVWQRFAWPAVLLAIVLQGLVFSPLGVSVNGNRNWIAFAGQRLQPSEAAKIALIVWAATVLCRKRTLAARAGRTSLVPVVFPVGIVVIGLVLAGSDLGHRPGAAAGAGRGAVRRRRTGPDLPDGRDRRWRRSRCCSPTARPNRMARIHAWLSGSCSDTLSTCFQSIHGKYALADGGWWGVGLGASREKWSLAPGGAQRLHLRDHRRGARPGRSAGGAGALRGRWPGPATGWSPAATTPSSGSPPPG